MNPYRPGAWKLADFQETHFWLKSDFKKPNIPGILNKTCFLTFLKASWCQGASTSDPPWNICPYPNESYTITQQLSYFRNSATQQLSSSATQQLSNSATQHLSNSAIPQLSNSATQQLPNSSTQLEKAGTEKWWRSVKTIQNHWYESIANGWMAGHTSSRPSTKWITSLASRLTIFGRIVTAPGRNTHTHNFIVGYDWDKSGYFL